MGAVLRAMQSFEQGWRNIPAHPVYAGGPLLFLLE
jgi:hypothetical protein